MKSLIDFEDVSSKEARKLINLTIDGQANPIKENITNTVVMKFDEPSTRTKVSFSAAANKLGMYQIDLTKESSSAEKGESLEDEILTLVELGVDIMVLRTTSEDVKTYKTFKNIGIISAGFGKVSHPTQAIVDASTILTNKNHNFSKPFVFIGDLKHSRVFSSAAELFPKLGIEVGICAPEEFLPKNHHNFKKYENITEAINKSSGIEILRVQKERIDEIDSFNFDNYINNFQLNKKILKMQTMSFKYFTQCL